MTWPGNAPFAAVLTHDIDQLYDREFFRVVADANHLRRTLFQGERGRAGECIARIFRSLFNPRDVGVDVERLRVLEQQKGFVSTFYFLMDRYRRNRYGARFQIEDPPVASLIRRLASEGCEIGVHGGFFDFDEPDYLTDCRERLETVSRSHVSGIRNHHLRFSGRSTWEAQRTAGLRYDATFGLNETIGPLGGVSLPFLPALDESCNGHLDILELPLTIMDTTLFRWLRLGGSEAESLIHEKVRWLAETGGVGVFLWHNNFFAEPEYEEWEDSYAALLAALEKAGAWVATGAEVSEWWRDSSNIRVVRSVTDPTEDSFRGVVAAMKDTPPFDIGVSEDRGRRQIEVDHDAAVVETRSLGSVVRVPRLKAGDKVAVRVGPSQGEV